MSPLYAARRRRDLLIRSLCFAAAGLGLLWLGLILWSLFANGVAGLSLDVFTQSTPPPGSSAPTRVRPSSAGRAPWRRASISPMRRCANATKVPPGNAVR